MMKEFFYSWAIPEKFTALMIPAFVMLLTLVSFAVCKRFFPYFFEKKKRTWNLPFLKALYKPLCSVILFIGSMISISFLAGHFEMEKMQTLIKGVRMVGGNLFLIWFSFKLIGEGEKAVKKRYRDETTLKAVSQLLRISVTIVTGLILAQTLGIPLSGVLAFGGIGGLAIGFASKDLLANFFGGLMIYFDRPFAIGDWIRSPDKEIEGTVENIGWRLTRIRTLDKRPLYVPNSYFSTIAIENPSRMSHRRIKTTVGVRYEDAKKIPKIVEKIETLLLAHPQIDSTKKLFASLLQFGPYSLDILIYAFSTALSHKDFQKAQGEILLQILEIIEEEGASVAYPTNSIHLPSPSNLLETLVQEKVKK